MTEASAMARWASNIGLGKDAIADDPEIHLAFYMFAANDVRASVSFDEVKAEYRIFEAGWYARREWVAQVRELFPDYDGGQP